MKRAARALAAALTRMDPAHEQDYKAGLARWNRKMDQLSSWARKELADIPEADRILVTGHAAMNHFCKEFGFRSISKMCIRDSAWAAPWGRHRNS